MKRNGPGARPAADTAATALLAPGTGTTRCPASRTARTTRAPGSETPGVPASVTRAIRSPRARRSINRAAASCSLCWWAAVSGVSMPNRASRGRVTRVSSAAITSIRASSQSARSVMSAALPMGNATTYNEPAGNSCSVTPETSNSRSCLLSARSPMIPTTTVARARHLVAALVLASVACSLRAQIMALPAQPPAHRAAVETTPSIALILPNQQTVFARAAEAVRLGFFAAHEAARSTVAIQVIEVDDDAAQLQAAIGGAHERGVKVVVGPLLRSEVNAVFDGGYAAVPLVALNYPDRGAAAPPTMIALGLSAEAEAQYVVRVALAEFVGTRRSPSAAPRFVVLSGARPARAADRAGLRQRAAGRRGGADRRGHRRGQRRPPGEAARPEPARRRLPRARCQRGGACCGRAYRGRSSSSARRCSIPPATPRPRRRPRSRTISMACASSTCRGW